MKSNQAGSNVFIFAFATLVCTSLAYGYPAWASFKAVDSRRPSFAHAMAGLLDRYCGVYRFEMLLEMFLVGYHFTKQKCSL